MPKFDWKAPIRPWVKSNPNNSDASRGRSPHAYDKRYHSTRWKRTRAIVLQHSPLCSACHDAGRVTPARVVDHITPVRRGGAFYDLENLQPMCDTCHNRKSGQESHQTTAFDGGRGRKNLNPEKTKNVESFSSHFGRISDGE